MRRKQRAERRQQKAEQKAFEKQEKKFLRAYNRAIRKHAKSIKRDANFLNTTKLPESIEREMTKFLNTGPAISDMRNNNFNKMDAMLAKIEAINNKYLPADLQNFNVDYINKSVKQSLLRSATAPIEAAKIEVAPTEPAPQTQSAATAPAARPAEPKTAINLEPPPSLQDIVDNLPEIPTAPTQEATAAQDVDNLAPSQPEPEIETTPPEESMEAAAEDPAPAEPEVKQSAEQLNAQIIELDAQIKNLITAEDEAAISGDFEKAGNIIDQREQLESQLKATVTDRDKLIVPSKKNTQEATATTTKSKQKREAVNFNTNTIITEFINNAKSDLAIKLSGVHLNKDNSKKLNTLKNTKTTNTKFSAQVEKIYKNQIVENKKQIHQIYKDIQKGKSNYKNFSIDELVRITQRLEEMGTVEALVGLLDNAAQDDFLKEEEKARSRAASEIETVDKKQEPNQQPDANEPGKEKGNKTTASNEPTEPSTDSDKATSADAAAQKTKPSPEKIQAAKIKLHEWQTKAVAKQANKEPLQEAPKPETETPKGPGGR